jgi:hypothetical protein
MEEDIILDILPSGFIRFGRQENVYTKEELLALFKEMGIKDTRDIEEFLNPGGKPIVKLVGQENWCG